MCLFLLIIILWTWNKKEVEEHKEIQCIIRKAVVVRLVLESIQTCPSPPAEAFPSLVE